MIETVVSQQLSAYAARAIYGRLAGAMGSRTPRPQDLLRLSRDQLIACGLSRSKADYVRNVASAFAERRLDRRSFARLDDAAAIEALTSIKGIGDWSAHMFLIFALRRLDVFGIRGPRGSQRHGRALRAAQERPRV